MKKYYIVPLMCTCLISCLTCTVYATDIKDIIPKEILNQYQLNDLDINDQTTVANSFSFSSIINIFLKSINKILPDFISFLALLIGIILLFSVLDMLSFTKTEGNYRLILSCFAGSVTLLVLIKYFSSSIEMVIKNSETIKIFCNSSIPIMTALLISSGKSLGASVFSYGVSLSSTLITSINLNVGIPLIRIYLAVGCCGSIWTDLDFGSICQMIKKFIKWLIGIVFSVFTFTFSIQNILSKSADNVASKLLKNAAASIPYLGGVLSKSVDSALTLAGSTKTASAIIGVAVIAAIFAVPALFLFLQQAAIFFSISFAELIGQKNCLTILKSFYGAYQLLLSLFLISVLMSIVCYLLICLGAT